jgi:predicted nucleic acid-binding protein
VYLLDTNVVSEVRRLKPHGAVVAWLAATSDELLFVSAVTIGELQAGVEITRDQDPAKAHEIERWIDRLANAYAVLALDAPIMRIWARLMHRSSDALTFDAMIAATALVHGCTVVTRNVRDFKPFAVPTLDPFAG